MPFTAKIIISIFIYLVLIILLYQGIKTDISSKFRQIPIYWNILISAILGLGYATLTLYLLTISEFFWSINSILIPIFSAFTLIAFHMKWHLSNPVSLEILNDCMPQNQWRKTLWKAWKNSGYIIFNNDYIAEIKPFNVTKFNWNEIHEIYGEERDAITTDSTHIYFGYDDNKWLVINDFMENFNEITTMMLKKFPSISKNWSNHVYNGSGNSVTLYTWKNEVY